LCDYIVEESSINQKIKPLMKKFSFTAIAIGVVVGASAQGWVSGASNTLYPVNASLSLSPLSVGVGTVSPTAQFHSTGTVRFAGLLQNDALTRILASDASGNLAWRDAATMGSGNSWLLTGNGLTNPTNNFLGTTDNQRLVFRTNNVERMTVLGTGNVGVGLSAPQRPLHVYSATGDNQLAVSGQSPSIVLYSGLDINLSPKNKFARIGVATGNTDFLPTSVIGDFVIQNLDTSASLLFGTYKELERMRISKIGYVGISTTAPTAKLHVNCAAVSGQSNPSNVRFQNLQTGTGNYLVMDANGYVYVDNFARPAAAGSSNTKELEAKVRKLEEELAAIKQMIQSNSSGTNSQSFIVSPNPASHDIVIRAAEIKRVTGTVVVTDLTGKPVAPRYTISESLTIPVNTLSAGSYILSFYSTDNKLIESQKIIVAK
jgi:hypothetical protein